MEWLNLKNKRCPYCSGLLIVDKQRNIFICTDCVFEIEPRRMRDIIEHRAHPERASIKKNHWENLFDWKCPTCANDLVESPATADFYSCSGCPFTITVEKRLEIITDEHHPACIFYNKKNHDNNG